MMVYLHVYQRVQYHKERPIFQNGPLTLSLSQTSHARCTGVLNRDFTEGKTDPTQQRGGWINFWPFFTQVGFTIHELSGRGHRLLYGRKNDPRLLHFYQLLNHTFYQFFQNLIIFYQKLCFKDPKFISASDKKKKLNSFLVNQNNGLSLKNL